MRARGPVLARRASTLTVTVCACVLAFAATACATVRQATPSNFSSVLGQAQPGDIVELAVGNYGRFNGAQKSGTVVIRSKAAGTAVMSPSF